MSGTVEAEEGVATREKTFPGEAGVRGALKGQIPVRGELALWDEEEG